MKGGTHVVSSTTYRFLSVALPSLPSPLRICGSEGNEDLSREAAAEKYGYVPLLKEEARQNCGENGHSR